MPRANLSKLADRDVTPVPTAEPAPSTAAPAQSRRPAETASDAEREEPLNTELPVSLKRELKATAAAHGEKMKYVVARAIRRELDRMQESN
jgi:hypothetical protein